MHDNGRLRGLCPCAVNYMYHTEQMRTLRGVRSQMQTRPQTRQALQSASPLPLGFNLFGSLRCCCRRSRRGAALRSHGILLDLAHAQVCDGTDERKMSAPDSDHVHAAAAVYAGLRQ